MQWQAARSAENGGDISDHITGGRALEHSGPRRGGAAAAPAAAARSRGHSAVLRRRRARHRRDVLAAGGHARVMDAYAHAIACGYRFYSYGDACLLIRTP